ncbi:hypothetical protein QR680_015322 [Steinernema hermaphroditum]|uniref:Uncharacterized protein n=1 Tax=Steinernema hermaphroditum TaxID=289476 RepID=A0AA39H9H0_9BILA|nr:hypothetical protein QR680_015322 [Steinernema hermaphroditum]
MSSRSGYACLIQGCNVFLIILGLAAVGLAGSQFSQVGLDNYRDIDLRILNWVHILTGFVGIHSVAKNHGSIVVKTLYAVSLVVSISTSIFYGFTTYRIVQTYNDLLRLKDTQGFQAEYGHVADNYVGKIVISSVMIGVGFVTALTALVAVTVLERLVVVSNSGWLTLTKEQSHAMRYSKLHLSSMAVVKLCLGVGAVGLAAFLEYLHELDGGTENYIKIALDHIAAMFVVCSAVIDLYAIFGRQQRILNLKVSIAMSIIAAVWCLKSVDNGMVPFYRNDLRFWRAMDTVPSASVSTQSSPKYIIVIVHGVLLGVFCLLFALCSITAVLAGSCIHGDYVSMNQKIDRGLVIQTRCLGFLHIVWSCCLIALVLLGLVKLPWNGFFLGGDLLWQAVLYFMTGVLGSSYYNTMTTTRFVMNICSFSIALEKTCATANLIYQSAGFPTFVNGDPDVFIGQIVLHSCQAGVLGLETITALVSAVVYGRAIRKQTSLTTSHSNVVHIIFSSGTLFYGVCMTGCYIVLELFYWRDQNAVPLDVPFFRLSNGPLAFVTFIVQLVALMSTRFLLAVTLLQTIVASLALFVISSAMTNTFYLQRLLSMEDLLRATHTDNGFLVVAQILAGSATIACALATLCGTISALRSSYLLHHRTASAESTMTTPLDGAYGTVRTTIPVSGMSNRTAVQPMEEQTVYWSADENPYFYHSSRRFYNQPYMIDSGFYGYSGGAQFSPGHEQQPLPHQHYQSQQHHQNQQPQQQQQQHSTGTQTRVSHVFREHNPTATIDR